MPLNSQTFPKVVHDPALDVVVFFRGSSACELCEELWPVFVQTARVLHKSLNLVFASINMSQNELTEEVWYYPTIRYYARDQKQQPTAFEGGVELQDMIKFVKRVTMVSLVEDYSELSENEEAKTNKEEL